MAYRLNRRKSPITRDTAYEQGWHRLGGGVDAEAFRTRDNTVILFTDNPLKIKYFYHLGILVNDWGWYVASHKGYDGRIWCDNYRTYVAELPLLGQLDEGEFQPVEDRLYFDTLFHQDWISAEWNVREHLVYTARRKFIAETNPSDYGEFWHGAVTAVKQIVRYVRSIHVDFHNGNVLKCPITGVLLPTDVFNIHNWK